MRKTYAYNSITIGVLVGIVVYATSNGSIALAILATLAVSVIGFVIFRVLENAIDKGADAAYDAAVRHIQKKNEERNGEDGTK